MKKQLLFAFGAAALLASCSNEIDSPVANVNDGYLQVNGTIDELKTRITDNGTDFTSGDEIGVYAVKGTATNVKYSYNAEGTDASSFTSEAPIKVNETGDSFTAYYPYNQDGGVLTFNVATAPVDYLFAESDKVTSVSPNVTFQFKHVMSKLAFTVENTGDAELDGATIAVSVADVVTDGSFDTKSGELTAGSKTSTLTDNVTDNKVSFIVPSFTTANNKELAVTVKVTNGTAVSTFKGTITPALLKGTQYNYTLNYEINKDEEPSQNEEILKVKGSAGGWESGGNAVVTTQEVLDPVDVGYFLLKNGKWISPEASNLDDVKDNIVGVVYYLGGDFVSGYSNGLAVALNDANESENLRFFSDKNGLTEDWQTNEKYSSLFHTDTNSLPLENHGFANTELLSEASNLNMTTYLNSYNEEKQVKGASKWYLPSFNELKLLCEAYDNITTSFDKLEDASLTAYPEFKNTSDGNFYWSSDFSSYYLNWVHSLSDLKSATKDNRISGTNDAYHGHFRFIIAF